MRAVPLRLRHRAFPYTLFSRRSSRIGPLSMGIRVIQEGRDEFQIVTLMSVTPGYLQQVGLLPQAPLGQLRHA